MTGLRASVVLLSLSACAPEMAADSACAESDDADVFSEGLRKSGDLGAVSVVLLSADPAPADKGVNTWTLQVLDSAGTAVEASSVVVSPWMPHHGHGTNPLEFDAAYDADAELYEVGPFDLFMPGLWEFTVAVEHDGQADEARFAFCIEG